MDRLRVDAALFRMSILLAMTAVAPGFAAEPPAGGEFSARRTPLVRVVDLDLGERAEVELADGSTAAVRLLDLKETRDPIREAVRRAEVTVEVNGRPIVLEAGQYNLPVCVGGVQIDCTVTGGYNRNSSLDWWGLKKDARLRLWPERSPLLEPGTFRYPLKQRWFATLTWYDNEPVDGGASISKKIYYHAGLDMGGTEGKVEVIAATDALVVSSGLQVLEEHRRDTPVKPRGDVVYLLDERGWYYRYSHLQSIDERIVPGRVLQQGERIGLLGKEGASGGWSHLHFEIKSRQPSGEWGTQAGYAFLHEAYVREHRPTLLACARPQQMIRAGETALLDGSSSWSAEGKIARYDWTFGDGTTATGAKVSRTYERPGRYSEILKVTGADGTIDYDFAVVQVLDPEKPDRYAPSLHATYFPTFGLKAGQPVTFTVRASRVTGGEEVWDFGDGSPAVRTRSDGNLVPLAADGYVVIEHRYRKPGHYLVSVERVGTDGTPATARLHVRIEE